MRPAPDAHPLDEWWIGLDGWILQDGNYTDFVTGEHRQFAVEFGYRHDRRLRPVSEPPGHRVVHSGRSCAYEVTGQLIRSSAGPHADGFVLDLGVLAAYSTWMVLDDLEPPTAGEWLTGEVHLGVDPFMYMDEVGQRAGMPALIHTWTIDEIQLDLTPSMRVAFGHPRYIGPDEGPRHVRDTNRESWRTVDKTRWEDDGSYRIRCTLTDVPATTTMASAGPASPYGPIPTPQSR